MRKKSFTILFPSRIFSWVPIEVSLTLNAVESGFYNQATLTKAPVVSEGKALSPGSAVSEKVRTRLEELDDLEEVSAFRFKTCIYILK